MKLLVPTYAVKTPTGVAFVAARDSLHALEWAKMRWGSTFGPYTVNYAPPRLVAEHVGRGAQVHEVPADFRPNKV